MYFKNLLAFNFLIKYLLLQTDILQKTVVGWPLCIFALHGVIPPQLLFKRFNAGNKNINWFPEFL